MLKGIIRRLIHHSPADNARLIRSRLETSENHNYEAPEAPEPRNDMLDLLLTSNRVGHMLGRALRNRGINSTTLHGNPTYLGEWLPGLHREGVEVAVNDWSWGDPISDGVIALPPNTRHHWRTIHEGGALTLPKLLAAFATIRYLHGALDYFRPFDEAIDYYLGYSMWPPTNNPIRALDAVVGLKGKTVIEFGPFDGYQTCGLVYAGAHVSSIEARPENIIKTRAALDAAGLSATLIADDFHNSSRYGSFDIAFAHGTYYHSVAPFVFLENLTRLAPTILVGGFCATDKLPATPWGNLEHDGCTYRAKAYQESRDYAAGINSVGYFFDADDLMKFFRQLNYDVSVLSDEERDTTSGRYVRFIAQRPV